MELWEVKPSTGGPSRIDENATGARSYKDPNNRGAMPGKRRVKESPEGSMPHKTPGCERYAILVGVEVSPHPGARLDPRSVPPHAWTEQIIWDYVGPAIPELTSLIVLNPMEFLVFRGSRSAGKGFNLEEAAVASAGLHDTETIWVGKPVRMCCVPRLLKEAAKDIEASREYVRRFNLDRITTSRAKKEAEVRAQRMWDMPPPPSPRGRGLVRRADRNAAQQYLAHQHSLEHEQLLQGAAQELTGHAMPSPPPRRRGGPRAREPGPGSWQHNIFAGYNPDGIPDTDDQFASAAEDQESEASVTKDEDLSTNEGSEMPSYETDASRRTAVGERNRRCNRGRHCTARRARRAHDQIRNNWNTRFQDISLFKDSQADNAISYPDWRDQVQGYIRQAYPEQQIHESVLAALEGTPKEMVQNDNDHSLRGILIVLDRIYGGAVSFNKLNTRLANITQSYSESVMDYFSRLMQLRTRLSKHHGHMYREGQLDKQVKEAFFTGLRPEYQALVSHVKDDLFKSTLDLFTSVWECEENEENSRRSRAADNARAYPAAVSRVPPAQARGNGNGGYQAHRAGNGYASRADRNAVPVKAMQVDQEFEDPEAYPPQVIEYGDAEVPNGEDPELELLTNFYVVAVQLADDTERGLSKCYNCHELGHMWRNCHHLLKEEFRIYQERMRQRQDQLNSSGGPGNQGGHVPQAPQSTILPVLAAPQQ